MLLFNICVFQNICEAKSSHIHHQISSSFSSPSSSNSQPTQLTQLTQLAYNRQEAKASKSHFCWSQFLRSSCSKAGCCILHRERKSQNLIGYCPRKVYWKILHYKLWWISTNALTHVCHHFALQSICGCWVIPLSLLHTVF